MTSWADSPEPRRLTRRGLLAACAFTLAVSVLLGYVVAAGLLIEAGGWLILAGATMLIPFAVSWFIGVAAVWSSELS